MAIRATKFTPSVLLSAPRRSPGIPNADGSLVLYTTHVYSFEDHEKTVEIRVLDVKSNESRLVSRHKELSEPNWLDDETVFLLESDTDGTTNVLVGPIDDFDNQHYVAGEIPAPASNFKLKQVKDGYALAFNALAKPNDELYNPDTAAKPHSTGKLYDSIWVRHWDTYKTQNRAAIWYTTIKKDDSSSSEDSKWTLTHLVNALQGTSLESPIPPFGGTDNFDLSSSGLIFVAKDPDLNQALNTKCNVYLISLSSFTQTTPSAPVKVATKSYDGAATSPVFSPDGRSAAFLAMEKNGYEADRNRVFVILDVNQPVAALHWISREDGDGKFWDRSPSGVTWSADSGTLFLTAEDEGKTSLFAAISSANLPGPVTKLTEDGSITDVRPLTPRQLFITKSSLVDNSTYQYLELPSKNVTTISSASRDGSAFGLSPSQVSEIWYRGASSDTKIHAWVVRPSTYNKNDTYPLAFLVHGGPQGAWTDSWSTRWNPAVFAEQGYITICPNPTGSTGYGQAFTDAIHQQWGGLPYEDLVQGFDYIERHMPDVDTSRAVALGASYGGYMMNWIQGHGLGRKFKALVTHDGVFSMAGQLASEELYFPFHDLGGAPTSAGTRKEWARWDPSLHIEEWKTPHLIIHNELDYRLTISEGLAAFNALQTRGVESRFLTFPDENHWVLKPENSMVWHRVVINWINRYVGLPALCKEEDIFTFATPKEEQDAGAEEERS
ncbi:alpha/beta-hydrolase [Viridothelium virens]|uniref:Dipeptidyl-peptidase V n=1 Tax=Viridothelium virens TaxID=1048519 RepID=A0A6A6H9K9_VIRVR|nr:alpha/beta-hydrolase [Viridothelium virens]